MTMPGLVESHGMPKVVGFVIFGVVEITDFWDGKPFDETPTDAASMVADGGAQWEWIGRCMDGWFKDPIK